MGDNIRVGAFSYNVLEVEYKSQLGGGTLAKHAQSQFIAIRLQATSSAGKTLSIPFLRLQNENGDWIPEVDDVSEMEGWLGVLRKVEPGATETGWIIFDAPVSSYGLLLSDGALEDEQTAFVRIPVEVNSGLK